MYCTIASCTDRHEASRGLSATATLLVLCYICAWRIYRRLWYRPMGCSTAYNAPRAVCWRLNVELQVKSAKMPKSLISGHGSTTKLCRKTAHSLSKVDKAKALKQQTLKCLLIISVKYNALAHLNLSTASFKCLSQRICFMGGPYQTIAMAFDIEKLEWFGYPMLKKI